MSRDSSEREVAGPDPSDRVAVLLATFNGQRFIDDQFRSLQAQTVSGIDVWVSDDGSTDATLDILREWQNKWNRGKFTILNGPGKGASENFRSLLRHPPISADHVALCDQDDVWQPDKLSSALAAISKSSSARPAAYFSRTRLVDASARPIGHSPRFKRPTGFRNAIVQSIGGANTLVMNKVAFALVRTSANRTSFVLPDWWCYILISGAGGDVHYDFEARLNYRQHEGNVVGANQGLRASVKRFRDLLGGRYAEWNEMNLKGLARCADLLDHDARRITAEFQQIRTSRHFGAVSRLLKSGIYRQTFTGNVALIFAAFFAKM